MRRALFLAGALMLAACEPSPGEEALAELDVSMRAEARMVERNVGLHEIFQDCSDDCSGHRAGYLWALAQDDLAGEEVCDPAAGESFYHGCMRGMKAASFL